MTGGFTDLHHHVLWGLDDGPRTPEQMHAMLALAAADGIARIAATPHAYPARRPFDMALYRARLQEANDYCRAQGLWLQLLEGCEIHYCDRAPDLLTAGRLPTLGGTRKALIEFDEEASLEEIADAADALYRAGFVPVVAHVERLRAMRRAPGEAMALREEYGLIYQMNCHTVLGAHGLFVRRFARKMLEARAIDWVATDAHDTIHRPVRMRAAYELLRKTYGAAYARSLVGLRSAEPGAEDEQSDSKERRAKESRSATEERRAKDTQSAAGERRAKGDRSAADERRAKGDRSAADERRAKDSRSAADERRAKGSRSTTEERRAKDSRSAAERKKVRGDHSTTDEKTVRGGESARNERKSRGDRSATEEGHAKANQGARRRRGASRTAEDKRDGRSEDRV